MKQKIIHFFITSIILFYSCSSSYKPQTYRMIREPQPGGSFPVESQPAIKKQVSVSFVSDSTLMCVSFMGCIGKIDTIKYKISHDTLFLDDRDIHGNKHELLSLTYQYSSDSLVGFQYNEKYFSAKYLDSIQEFQGFYIIENNKKYKITGKRKAIRFAKKHRKDSIIILDKDSAKSKYAIDKKYTTFKIIDTP